MGALELEGEQARLAVAQDRAEVIRLGCGGMAGLRDIVATYVEVPIVDGVIAAMKLAEGLVRLGLSTSRACTSTRLSPNNFRMADGRRGAVVSPPIG